MLKKISKQKENKNHQNKQTHKHNAETSNKNHYKPQNHPWNRLKDSSRNILVSIVVKSAFKHLKKIENTIRKSEQSSGSPALHPLQCLVKKWALVLCVPAAVSPHDIPLPSPKLSAM